MMKKFQQRFLHTLLHTFITIYFYGPPKNNLNIIFIFTFQSIKHSRGIRHSSLRPLKSADPAGRQEKVAWKAPSWKLESWQMNHSENYAALILKVTPTGICRLKETKKL